MSTKTAKYDIDNDVRYPFCIEYVPLRKNLLTATGLSLSEGEPVQSISDLPLFKVEIRIFRDGSLAESFVQGLEVVGMTNKVAFTWEPGDMLHNKTVIVGLLQEEVLSDTPYVDRVKIVRFQGNNHDSAAIARGLEKSIRENRESSERQSRKEQALFEPLVALGFKMNNGGYHGNKAPSGASFGIRFAQGHYEGPYSLHLHCEELAEGSIDVTKQIEAAVLGSGFKFDEIHRDLEVEGIASIEDVPAVLERMEVALKVARAAKAAVWRADLERRVKMNPSRKRFLSAANNFGIREFWQRGNQKASCGGETIGMTEIHNLLTIGWIERTDGKLQITEAGRLKAGIVDEVKSHG